MPHDRHPSTPIGQRRRRRARAAPLLAAAVLGLGACASAPPLAPGASRAEALERLAPLTGRYALPDGRERLEFARGPFGRQTWMVDVDAAGRVLAVQQVLDPAHLAAFQWRAAGVDRAELLRTLGRPADRRHGGSVSGGEVWSYRFPTNDCLWYEVTIGPDGRVRGAGENTDPACDVNDGGLGVR